MEAFETMRTVLAVRKYRETPVPPEIARRIVEDRDTLRQLGALVRTGPYIAQASLAIAVAMEQSPFAVSDACRAIQSMILTAWSEGVGSNWTGFHGLTTVKSLLGTRMAWMCWRLCRLAIRRRRLAGASRSRKPLAEVAHHEHLSQPFV